MTQGALALAVTLTLATAAAVPATAQQRQPGQQAEVTAAAFTAEVTGQVKNVDHKSGKLTLDTGDGQVNVRFPPEAVQAVKPGDQVTVAFGLIKPPPAASPSSSGTK